MVALTNQSSWTIAATAITTVLVVLAAVGTIVIRIPIPATTGYFNIGDVFVMLAGLWIGPLAGFLVGALGPTAADAIGYPQFILATAVTKACEGLLVGLIGHGLRTGMPRKILAVTSGAVVIVGGYFLFEGFVYPWLGKSFPFFNVTTVEAAFLEVPFNVVQGVIGAVAGLGLWKAIAGYDPKRRSVQ